jgi:hypothetical protein
MAYSSAQNHPTAFTVSTAVTSMPIFSPPRMGCSRPMGQRNS